MSPTDALILGIVQGLTEFLPVSSSGHLVITERLLGVRSADLTFPIAVHIGTLVAVIVYFRSRIWAIIRSFAQNPKGSVLASGHDNTITGSRMFLLIILASVPAGIAGVLFKDQIELAFASPQMTAICLMVTGVWLLLTLAIKAQSRALSWWRAWWIGVAQAVAIIPGISRSGSTIATGMMLGVRPEEAAEFSFLLSIPAVLGATILAIPKALAAGQIGMIHIVGLVVSTVTGYLALRLVFAVVRHGRFAWFGVYCLAAGGTAAIWLG